MGALSLEGGGHLSSTAIADHPAETPLRRAARRLRKALRASSGAAVRVGACTTVRAIEPPSPPADPDPSRPSSAWAGPAAPPISRRRAGSPGALAAALAILATLLAVAATSAVVRTRSAGITHPDEWDPRIEDIADFVAEQTRAELAAPRVRGLPRRGGVHRRGHGGRSRPLGRRARRARAQRGVFRALGLMEGEVDLLDGAEPSCGARACSPSTIRRSRPGRRRRWGSARPGPGPRLAKAFQPQWT